MNDTINVFLYGPRNPVTVAKMYLDACGIEIDEESYQKVSKWCGDSPEDVANNGFVVDSLVDFMRLCEIGQFDVSIHNKTASFHQREINDLQ